MKVLQISTHDQGGAAIACIRQHIALVENGVDSVLLTSKKTRNDLPNHYGLKDFQPDMYRKKEPKSALFSYASKLLNIKNDDQAQQRKSINKKVFDEIGSPFTFIDTEYDITNLPIFKEANVINLHWVSNFIDWESFFEKTGNKKIVWTLHDMNPFTGGYHYGGSFTGYKNDESGFPPFQNTEFQGMATNLLSRKKEILDKNKIKIDVVGDSDWLSSCARESSLFKDFDVKTIYYSLDTDLYKIHNKQTARALFKIPADKTVVLFVSQNVKVKRKGFDLLLDSFSHLKGNKDILLCSIGKITEDVEMPENVEYQHLGVINDDRLMALAYNAADLFVIPSREEAFGQTVIEAQCCGTPVIGFAIGGVKEIIDNEVNGYLIQEPSSEKLAEKIITFLGNRHQFDAESISEVARKQYRYARQAKDYIELYTK